MPLALLLQTTTKAFDAGAKGLGGWTSLVFLEETVLARMRSLFIVRWFGRTLPLHDRALRVAFSNLEALRARYQAVRAERAAPEGLNLMETSIGITGTLVGMIASPAGAITATFALFRTLSGQVGVLGLIGLALAAVVLGPIGGGILLAAGGLVGAGALLTSAVLPSTRGLALVHRFLGALAEALYWLTVLVNQLLGPRSGVRNPLLVRLLEVGDRLAVLIPQAIGFAAVMLTYGYDALRPLTRQLLPLYRLIEAVMDTVAFILANMAERFARFFDARHGIVPLLRYALAQVVVVIEIMVGVFQILPGDLKFRLLEWWQRTEKRLDRWWAQTKRVLHRRVRRHPAWAMIEAIEARFTTALAVFASAGTRAAPSGPFMTALKGEFRRATGPALRRLRRRTGGDITGYIVGPLAASPLPDAAAIERRLGGGPAFDLDQPTIDAGTAYLRGLRARDPSFLNPFTLSPEADRAVRGARYPRSVFAAERARLERETGMPIAERFRALRAQERPLRDALAAVVASALPASAAAYVVELDDLFQSIDDGLYRGQIDRATDQELDAAARRELPIREILESRRLQPVVRTLRVRAAGHARMAADAWAEGLRRQLETQPYVASDAP